MFKAAQYTDDHSEPAKRNDNTHVNLFYFMFKFCAYLSFYTDIIKNRYWAQSKCKSTENWTFRRLGKFNVAVSITTDLIKHQGYSSGFLMSTTIIIGLLLGFRLVGLLEADGPQSSPISIKSSADIRQHFSVLSSSTLIGSIDCKKVSCFKESRITNINTELVTCMQWRIRKKYFQWKWWCHCVNSSLCSFDKVYVAMLTEKHWKLPVHFVFILCVCSVNLTFHQWK